MQETHTINLFGKDSLRNFLSERNRDLEHEVRSEDKNSLLNVNEKEYVDYLVSKYDIVPLNFQWEIMDVSDKEELIPAERFPPNQFHVTRGRSYPRQVLVFHVPYIGEKQLLTYEPAVSLIDWHLDVEVDDRSIHFEVVNWKNDGEQVKRTVENVTSRMKAQLRHVLDEVVRYNISLLSYATHAVNNRKQELLKMENLLESLGVPIKKSESVPDTFSVPIKKSLPLIKPTTTSDPYQAEPALDAGVYNDILKICYQTGVEMERHPSIYFERDEETLRDHFLMVLSPHFQSVTGETFNKKGKTDILIRHEQSNVFVAEFKFWAGAKSFFKTIDQILRYLTWRDSKTAIICFIKNKDVEAVINQIKESAKDHPCFISFESERKEGWLEFNFKLEADNPRGLTLTILCFHFTE